MSAIPTRYAGVQFRSRLEARWAAFFDLVGWTWEYEPLDLNGYIPDFIINPLGDAPTPIEVKPILHWPCPVLGCVDCHDHDRSWRALYDEAVVKIQNSGWVGPALLVGATLVDLQCSCGPGIGRSASVELFDAISPERVLVKCRRCPRMYLSEWLDLENSEDFNRQRYCDCDDDNERPADSHDPVPLWRAAGNRVQWASPGGAR